MAPLNRRNFLKASATTAAIAATAPFGAADTQSKAFQEYRQYDAIALANKVKRGEVSPSELLDLAISRCEAVNPTLNAVVLQHFDLARAAVKKGLPQGALKGVPFLLKDLGIAMDGTITTHGSRFFKDNRPSYDSTLVKRYKAAGLAIFGKTHSPEFGGTASSESALFGQTHNPWNLQHSAGGSSGGAAAAVAAGIVPAAHASDGGGSIRIPASACGLFGLKPSRGRVPLGPPDYEARNGCSTAHVISRSVRDSALLLDLTQGADLGDPYGQPRYPRPYLRELEHNPGQLRIALMTHSLLPLAVDPDCVAAAEQAAKLCESLGHRVEPASPKVDVQSLYTALGLSTDVYVADKVSAWEKRLQRAVNHDELERITWQNLQRGRAANALDYTAARRAMHQASAALAAFQQNYDLILSPTMAMVPPRLGVLSLQQDADAFMAEASRASAFTSLYNLTGQPAMSVPLYWTQSGLPVGVMFTGRFAEEDTLFRLAAQLEQVAPWFDRTAPEPIH